MLKSKTVKNFNSARTSITFVDENCIKRKKTTFDIAQYADDARYAFELNILRYKYY